MLKIYLKNQVDVYIIKKKYKKHWLFLRIKDKFLYEWKKLEKNVNDTQKL